MVINQGEVGLHRHFFHCRPRKVHLINNPPHFFKVSCRIVYELFPSFIVDLETQLHVLVLFGAHFNFALPQVYCDESLMTVGVFELSMLHLFVVPFGLLSVLEIEVRFGNLFVCSQFQALIIHEP